MILEQYIFLFIIFSIAAYFLYTRIRYPFWSHMPISHTYDYINLSDKLIQTIPKRNKFCETNHIKTTSFFELDDHQQKSVSEILNCYYIPSDVIFSTVSPEILKTRMTGHFDTPFVSTDPSFAIGCVASYPVHTVYLSMPIQANYLTYLAVSDNKQLVRNLISTHDYNIRNKNPNINTTLYKKHTGRCNGAKPLVEFRTSVFYINVDNDTKLIKNTSIQAHVIQIYKTNWHLMQDFYDSILNVASIAMFDFVAIMDIGALKARVDANQLYIYAYRVGTQIMALYFIDDMNTLYENVADYGGKTLSLVASVNNMIINNAIEDNEESKSLFYNGFVEVIHKIVKQNRDYKMMVIDDLGHNRQIVEYTKKTKETIFETEGGYYWINQRISEPTNSLKTFILVD